MLVWIVAIRGEWSEVGLLPVDRREPGKREAKSRFRKARSILAKVGEARLLVHVKRQSERGSSMSSKVLIVLLKREASDLLKLPLLLSFGWRVKLKSPMRSHEPR